MASKQELIDKIQTIARRVYTAKVKKGALGITPDDVNFDKETFPILSKFSSLKQVIINLLTDQYESFISDIHWVAPRPTTFKIILANKQFFYLIYTDRSWIVKVEGKKYYLLNIAEEERATESIARVLMYGNKAEPEKDLTASVPPGNEETPTEETPPPSEEIPPAGEEVPEELPA